VIGLTLGDPSGIGPELCARLLRLRGPEGVRVYGDRGILERAAAVIGVELPEATSIVEVSALPLEDAAFGRPTRAGGAAQIAYLEAALADAVRGRLAGVCTAPISKTSAAEAGFAFPGQTELCAARAGVTDFAMMLAGPTLRVALVTTHMSLGDAVAELRGPRGRGEICRVITLAARALSADFALATPRLGVAGLNPHAGEGGLFGREEIEIIGPAMDDARQALEREGVPAVISGPHVPDVVFRRAAAAELDAVICMTHDQGLIPLKLLDFDSGVNLTLGLPFPRTSPDHGVAYDIAGTGRARADSLIAAYDLAVVIAAWRALRQGPSQ
jgi:4-hydroxythreonine-4-phosphate dehydrogenase